MSPSLMFQYSVTLFSFAFLFLFRLQTWVLAQRPDEQTSIHDRWFGWSIRASDSSFRSSPCYNDINAVVIDGKESFADLKNPHPPRLMGPRGGERGTQSFIRGDFRPKVQTFTPLYTIFGLSPPQKPFCIPPVITVFIWIPRGSLCGGETLESFRFQDEDDYENEIFSILSSARAREPTSFWRENVVAVVNTFPRQHRGKTSTHALSLVYYEF